MYPLDRVSALNEHADDAVLADQMQTADDDQIALAIAEQSFDFFDPSRISIDHQCVV